MLASQSQQQRLLKAFFLNNFHELNLYKKLQLQQTFHKFTSLMKQRKININIKIQKMHIMNRN